jgi:hypothetical protein
MSGSDLIVCWRDNDCWVLSTGKAVDRPVPATAVRKDANGFSVCRDRLCKPVGTRLGFEIVAAQRDAIDANRKPDGVATSSKDLTIVVVQTKPVGVWNLATDKQVKLDVGGESNVVAPFGDHRVALVVAGDSGNTKDRVAVADTTSGKLVAGAELPIGHAMSIAPVTAGELAVVTAGDGGTYDVTRMTLSGTKLAIAGTPVHIGACER